ncbi:RNA polymerase sigma factor [Bacillus kwashiorkori]|uniref:RNA polymerase sigma factor n=1 Tax=Bacillus kwashiorkori TaxID=1522318 RepID=UPI0007849BF6|nr:sigma-70 family RNA polymerase sigma factor [Bacillus kwashiorkori]
MDDNQESIRLLDEIAHGSRQAFDTFYEKHISFVYQIALHIVQNETEAEDIAQDVFLEVFQKYKQYDSKKGSVKAWLAVKTKSRSIDRLRKKKPLLVNRLELLLKQKEKGADVQFFSELQNYILIDALNAIPFDQREAIIRAYFNGETHKEIAGRMHRPLGSVKSLIRYGLNNLRKQKTLLHWVKADRSESK